MLQKVLVQGFQEAMRDTIPYALGATARLGSAFRKKFYWHLIHGVGAVVKAPAVLETALHDQVGPIKAKHRQVTPSTKAKISLVSSMP